MIIKRNPITYKHETVVYVPVFQVDFDKDGNLLHSSTFHYSFADASEDPSTVYSLNPDYVLTLTGTFNATTQPIVFPEEEEDKPCA